MRHDRHFVDELANQALTGVGMLVPIAQIETNPEQPRTDMGDLEDLTKSVRERGILEPLLVRRTQSDRLRYQLVAGERRFQAALRAGLNEVPCVEVAASDQEALELALIENLQRRDLSPFEEAEGYQRLSEKYGYTHEQIASAVGKSRPSITESLKLLAIPPAIRDLCRHADITAKSVLLLVARAASIDEMEQLVQQIVESNLDRHAARATSHRLRAGAPTDEDHETASAGGGSSSGEAAAPPGFRPVQIRFRPSTDAPVHFSLSLRRPGITRNEIIAMVEDLLGRLRRGELDERLTPRQ